MTHGTAGVVRSHRRTAARPIDAASGSDESKRLRDGESPERKEHLEELEVRNQTLRDTERAVLNVLEDTLELQERFRVEAEELRKFRMAVDRSPIHTVITDTDGIILYANDAVVETTGYSSQEMFGQTPRLWGKQMDLAFYERLWKTIKTDRKPFLGEITNKRKDGELYIVEAGIYPLLDESGDLRFFVGVERDVTAERRYEERLVAQAEDLRRANETVSAEKDRAEGVLRFLRSIGDGVFATDRDGRIVFMNESAERLSGCLVANVMGSSYGETFCFSYERNPAYGCVRLVEEMLEDELPRRSVPSGLMLTRRDGTHLPVSCVVSPIHDVDGGVVGAIVTVEDTSRDRQAEQMKSDFLSIAAHQLRTPLTGIRWSLEMLLDEGGIPEPSLGELRKIYESSRRMSVLIDDLIDATRIGQQVRSEVPEKTDPAELVSGVIRGMDEVAKTAGVTVTLRSVGRSGKTPVLRECLSEIVRNLLSNAIKYSRKGGEVTVTVSRRNGTVRVSVADQGIGIPKGEQDRVFSRFFRATNAILKDSDGSGIGLSAVKDFLDDMGGRIWFESEEGEGTTFFVEVPDLAPSVRRAKKDGNSER